MKKSVENFDPILRGHFLSIMNTVLENHSKMSHLNFRAKMAQNFGDKQNIKNETF